MKLIFIVLLSFLASCSTLTPFSKQKLSIIQGLTNKKEVEFSVLSKNKNLQFNLVNEANVSISPHETKIIERASSDWVVHKIYFQREDESFSKLKITSGLSVIDERVLGAGITNSSEINLVVASCMDDRFKNEFRAWNHVIKANPNYLLMIGDNVYADSVNNEANPKELWKRYVETRLSLPIFFSDKLIPIHALWDDHDFGINNGNKSYKFKTESKEIFDAFFAQSFSNENYQGSFGVAGLLSLGDFNLYFLDSRMFRDEDPKGLHLGMDQEAWLMTSLKEEKKPSLIIKGDQFFGGYHVYESFEGSHPENFKSFVSQIKGIKTPFIFLSGDRHLSEIMQFPRSLFGIPSYEITSSPIHGNVYPSLGDNNPWRVTSIENKANFIVLKNRAQNDHWFIDIESISADGETLFKRDIAVYIKDLQESLNEVRKRRQYRRRPIKSKRR